MSTLIYSPGVNIIIDSAVEGLVNVSLDASSGSLSLRENGSHNLRVTLENPLRKYDGIFVPNDRIVVQMKRFKWMQVFAGYIDSAPYFSTYPGQVQLEAQCSLKVLKYWPWDRGSSAAQELLTGYTRDKTAQDGGISKIITDLLTNVALWPEERIHIGRIPSDWLSAFNAIYSRLDDGITKDIDPLIGVNPILAGREVGGFPGAGGGIAGAGAMGGTVLTGRQQELVELVTRYQFADRVTAIAIILGESGGDPLATNRELNGNIDRGLWQISSRWHPHVTDEQAFDVDWSTQYAFTLSKGGTDWTPWHARNAPRFPSHMATARRLIDEFPSAGTGTTAPGTSAGPSTIPNSGILYPIPAGVRALNYSEVGWGGHRNGHIPSSAMSSGQYITSGHPLAVESYEKMAAEASRAGLDIRGSCYRPASAQATIGPSGAAVGKSNHGWGLAIDISVLVPNDRITRKYRGYTNDQMFSTPEYQWLRANAYKWGWGHPTWAQQGQPRSEAWHWEFFAIYNFPNSSGNPTQAGVDPFNGVGGIGGFPQVTATQLFSALSSWTGVPQTDFESVTLSGFKTLMNDEALLPTIKQYCHISGRSYCTAPNGDFMAWFPDYWGEYGLAGVMDIKDIELKDFSVNWSDENLITHQFVEGAVGPGIGPAPQGLMDGIHALYTRGVATVEMNNLMNTLLNVRDSSQYPWLSNPEMLLGRFGARVDRNRNPYIQGPQQEFFFAVQRLTRAWAKQFTARAPLTFMPELYPGMLMKISSLGVQMYVTGVTHSWSYANKAGFTTDVEVMAPSATDGSGFYLFPKGGDKRPSGSSNATPWGNGGGDPRYSSRAM